MLGLHCGRCPLLRSDPRSASARSGVRVYIFFTKAALVTFGGAYAVLGYVTTHLVGTWAGSRRRNRSHGLALAETTPGPLVIVLQFLGYMAGWNSPGHMTPLGLRCLPARWRHGRRSCPRSFSSFSARRTSSVSRASRASSGALAAITAAVVGIIATLAVLLAKVVLFPNGLAGPLRWDLRWLPCCRGPRSSVRAGRCRPCLLPRQSRVGCLACCNSGCSRASNTSRVGRQR